VNHVGNWNGDEGTDEEQDDPKADQETYDDEEEEVGTEVLLDDLS